MGSCVPWPRCTGPAVCIDLPAAAAAAPAAAVPAPGAPLPAAGLPPPPAPPPPGTIGGLLAWLPPLAAGGALAWALAASGARPRPTGPPAPTAPPAAPGLLASALAAAGATSSSGGGGRLALARPFLVHAAPAPAAVIAGPGLLGPAFPGFVSFLTWSASVGRACSKILCVAALFCSQQRALPMLGRTGLGRPPAGPKALAVALLSKAPTAVPELLTR